MTETIDSLKIELAHLKSELKKVIDSKEKYKHKAAELLNLNKALATNEESLLNEVDALKKKLQENSETFKLI